MRPVGLVNIYYYFTKSLQSEWRLFLQRLILPGLSPYFKDLDDVIVHIHPGTGGEEGGIRP